MQRELNYVFEELIGLVHFVMTQIGCREMSYLLEFDGFLVNEVKAWNENVDFFRDCVAAFRGAVAAY